ncbi:MAG TPA: hypothetical protein VFD66_14580 [Verrucomicrobiae bacterium]|nr:hypothetical protein [Verrucomicrobiae bacterium]
MIGVAVDPADREVAGEFFELFKTPWEFWRKEGSYDAVLCTLDSIPDQRPRLLLLYGSRSMPFDQARKNLLHSRYSGTGLVFGNTRIPIHGGVATFACASDAGLREESSGKAALFAEHVEDSAILRVGYDLFDEIRHLLTVGQPAKDAGLPTLELHIALLRNLMTGMGLAVVEIPPIPDRHPFIVCLTHDIDHPAIRNHWCDHTMFGFLYRATVGTLTSVCRGRKPLRDLCSNWTAALKLPFVYLGMAQDFWAQFDRYATLEQGMGSTYFVIPRKNDPGKGLDGNVAAARAARYDLVDVEPQLKRVLSSGCEVELHGIDAWCESGKGREEGDMVSQALGTQPSGVRMHWLYFDSGSPRALEEAGFLYDSTFGYNEAVGYRAGTGQVYKSLGTAGLYELPLHVMDTALFYPGRLNLSDADAWGAVLRLIDVAARFGGVLTLNWHDRSIAPERLWEGFYLKLLQELKSRGAWFPGAAEAVGWFRARRSASFDFVRIENGVVKIKASVKAGSGAPGFRIRVHRPKVRKMEEPVLTGASPDFVDIPFQSDIETAITF